MGNNRTLGGKITKGKLPTNAHFLICSLHNRLLNQRPAICHRRSLKIYFQRLLFLHFFLLTSFLKGLTCSVFTGISKKIQLVFLTFHLPYYFPDFLKNVQHTLVYLVVHTCNWKSTVDLRIHYYRLIDCMSEQISSCDYKIIIVFITSFQIFQTLHLLHTSCEIDYYCNCWSKQSLKPSHDSPSRLNYPYFSFSCRSTKMKIKYNMKQTQLEIERSNK